MPIGTAKFRLVIGLWQISWLPRPCRTKMQPAARNKSRGARSNCGAIQTAADSASRNAVICKNSEAGSTSG
jgi:hypothetical protein